jgi:uncharacterized protein YecE (DUF72 family)
VSGILALPLTNENRMNKVFIGTSGFNYRDWKGKFYPDDLAQREWLSYYARQFKTIEINNSFYTVVRKETYEKWYQQTPGNFSFVIKGHRFITQLKKLNDVDDAVELFFSNVTGLREKLSCVLWQFPKSFRLNGEKIEDSENFKRLQQFLTLLPPKIRYAFEFRDISWFVPEVNELLQQHNASLVISQSNIFPEVILLNNTFAYLRFHGPAALYSSGYSDEELRTWAGKIKQFQQTQDVYIYFNNDAGGRAIENTRTLQYFLSDS